MSLRAVDPVINQLQATGTLESEELEFDQIEARLSDVVVALQYHGILQTLWILASPFLQASENLPVMVRT